MCLPDLSRCRSIEIRRGVVCHDSLRYLGAIFAAFFLFFRSLFVSRLSLAAEMLVLRQQLLLLNRSLKRPKLRRWDRLFWVCLSRLWKDWRDALIIIKPDT